MDNVMTLSSLIVNIGIIFCVIIKFKEPWRKISVVLILIIFIITLNQGVQRYIFFNIAMFQAEVYSHIDTRGSQVASLHSFKNVLVRCKGDVEKEAYIYMRLGDQCIKLKKYDQASSYYREALKRGSRESEEKLRKVNDFYYKKSLIFYNAKKYKSALELFDKYFQILDYLSSKHDIEALRYKGNCFYYLERFEEAELIYNKILLVEEKDPRVYHNLGLIYYRKKDYRRANDYLTKYKILNKGENKSVEQILSFCREKISQ